MALRAPQGPELEELEVGLLLDAVHRAYGYDFREYAPASLRRRLHHCVRQEGLPSVSGLQERILHDAGALERLLLALSVHVTAMFRDPSFCLAFRQQVAPLLQDQPLLRIWTAGCATGEEVYSFWPSSSTKRVCWAAAASTPPT
jgi:chemotaxis protein methyltransferase CheR